MPAYVPDWKQRYPRYVPAGRPGSALMANGMNQMANDICTNTENAYFCISRTKENRTGMNNRNLPIFIDVIFCVILLPLMIMFLPVERWLTHHTFFVLIFVVWLYVVYFLHRKITVPLIFSGKKYLAALLILVFTVILTWLVSGLDWHGDFLRHHRPAHQRHFLMLHPREQAVWFLFFVVSTFSFAVGLLTELYHQMLEKKELEQEKSKAELALYKAQINPHFLFNTLNTLYGLLITGSEKAEQAFMQFTGMMKYMYSKTSADFIPVSDEAEYIRQYIDLQKLRLNGHTAVSFESEEGDDEAVIAPMLLITFVENAFKYGVSSHIDSRIDIWLSSGDGKISFIVRNRIFPESLSGKGEGIGIANCRKRLSLIYPGAHSLKITDSDGVFAVNLTIMYKKVNSMK